MPESKKPLIRYQVIDRCLLNPGRQYAYEDLLAEINKELVYRGFETIGRTTFYQDIKDMQVEFQAPIDTYWEGRKKYYRYEDPDYRFANQPLNQGEVDNIKDAAMILSRFSGLPGFEWIDEVVSKMELGTFEQVADPHVIAFESNEFLKGKEYIGPLFRAIVDKTPVEVEYQTFDAESSRTHLIHPYHLKEYDSRWYIMGYYPKRDVLMTLSVDRIGGVKVLSDTDYIENKRWDFADYFEDVVGIRKEEEQEAVKIQLKFSKLMSSYIDTKPLHGSQKVLSKEEDGSTVIQIEVIPNFEVENLIFSFKDEVEVLGPPAFRDRVKGMVERMQMKYGHD